MAIVQKVNAFKAMDVLRQARSEDMLTLPQMLRKNTALGHSNLHERETPQVRCLC